MDLGEFGIRVNAVSPGRVEGPRIEQTLHHGAAQAGMEYADYVEHLKSQTPLHTFIPPGATSTVACMWVMRKLGIQSVT